MAPPPGDISGASIVLLGTFDPLHAQPADLLWKGLLNERDVTELRYEAAMPDLVIATLPWMRIIIERERLMAAATLQSPAAEPVRDFVIGLAELMLVRHVTAVGLNRDQHFATPSQEVWHRIGHLLAPKDVLWDRLLKSPGLQSLSIRGDRPDGEQGFIVVKIEPSTVVPHGIYVHVNDHFQATAEVLESNPYKVLDVLTDRWSESMLRADQVIAGVKGLL
jgi:hypothetical protein